MSFETMLEIQHRDGEMAGISVARGETILAGDLYLANKGVSVQI